MTTSTKIRSDHTHAVLYVGAPYGDSEGGHIVSLHKSEEAAQRNCDGYAGEIAVDLDEPTARHPGTPREYFA